MDNRTFADFCGSYFFDYEETLGNTTVPILSECFRRTVLIWVPVCFLLAAMPLQIYFFYISKALRLPWTALLIIKLCLMVVLVVVTATEAVHALISAGSVYPVHYCAPLLLLIAMVVLLFLMIGCRQRGLITSGVIFLAFLMLAICGAPEFQHQIQVASRYNITRSTHATVRMICYLVYYPVLLVQLCLSAFADKPAQYAAVGKGGEKPCPENYASFLNRITFNWFTGMAIVGWRRSLTSEDMWALNFDDSSKMLVKIWEKIWFKKMSKYWKSKQSMEAASRRGQAAAFRATAEEVRMVDGVTSTPQQATKGPPAPSIVSALFWCFWRLFVPATITKTIADALQFLSPQLLSALIGFVANKDEPMWKGYAYATMMFIVALLYSVLLHQYFHWMMRLGMNVRTVLISAIFTKCLRLSNTARKKRTVGEIVNLMSVDTQRFMDVATYINMLWSSPFQIALSLYFLWLELGPAVLSGLALMILLVPLNYYLSTIQRKFQVSQMKFKDDRIKLINEILNGIKVLKLYAWEKSFEKQVLEIRQQELKVLKKSAYFLAASSAIWTCAPLLVAVVSFGTYVLMDPVKNVLTPQRAFVSLALFNILRFPMTVLPMFISFMVQASVSNKRIKDFLVAEELDPSTVDKNGKQEEAVKIEQGSFTWEQGSTKPTLQDINLSVMPGQLVAVVGQVGSGKSSVLSAILGEMDKINGNVATKGRIAYVPQLAWIQNMTLRDNVTFTKSYDQAAFDNVITACALEADINMLPGGDQTEIGEKGINLSGGQKQRVSLARAVYQDADIFLLDDPLSAVDAHVGRHIFENVISNAGMLKGKTRVLVTHGLGYLKHVNNIVVMKDGRILEMGTYDELLAKKGAFAELITTYLTKKAQELDEEEADEEVTELEEVLEDLSKVDPSVRAKLVSQLSHDASSSPKSPSPERSLHRLISRQQSLLAALTTGKKQVEQTPADPTGKPPSPVRAISQQSTARSRAGKGVLTETKDGKGAKMPVTNGTKIMSEEQTETGNVKFKVYKDYFQALGWSRLGIIVLLYAISNGFNVGTNVWLAEWSDEAKKNGTAMSLWVRLSVYGGLGVAQTAFILCAALIASYSMVIAGGYLHSTLLRNVLRSPMSFFDVTPLGRIVNRVGKDVDTVDNTLPQNLRSWILCVLSVLSTIVVICVSTPLFATVVLPLGLLYYFVQRFYISTSRQLKRIESVNRSPIYSHFQETVAGAVSIRAYSSHRRFIEESERRVDMNQGAYYPNIVSNRWLAIRLELVGNLIIFFAAVFAVASRNWDGTTAGLVGLSVSYALSVTQTLNWAVRMTSDVEANIVSVERIKEYSESPTEAPWETSVKPPANWPHEGRVDLEHYSLRYRPDLELILKDVTCNVRGGERVGIVGRTGAGKSSLTLALFRIVEPAGGRIIIDNVDISKIGLQDLRSRLTIIPQDPVLFSGTLRMNLDPFEQYSDVEVWRALEHSHLKDFIAQLPAKLMSPVTEGGENMSVGQRQLLCLARALLRKTKVLVLDEATSAVDLETEDLILKTIRSYFAECTVLTIAHRLNTIIDSNRVLVLSNGRIAEFDSPNKLLNDTQSLFYDMAKDANLIANKE